MIENNNNFFKHCHNPNNNPTCKKIQTYTTKFSLKSAIKKQTVCQSCNNYDKNRKPINYQLDNLLLDIPESFYWMGFILADGHISNSSKLFTVSCSIKDELHLMKLANYINCDIKYHAKFVTKIINQNVNKISKYCLISLYDRNNIIKIKNKFDICGTKTVCPPNINVFKSFSNDQIFALIAGFIDGDGCIFGKQNKITLQIRIHKNWFHILEYFKLIIGESSRVYVASRDEQAALYNSNYLELKNLKRKLIELKIPLMSRKWDKINLSRLTQDELAIHRFNLFLELYETEKRNYKLSEMIGVGRSTISYYIKQFNLGIRHPYINKSNKFKK